MTRREKIAWSAIGAVYVIGFLSLIPSYHEICEVTEKANNEHCPAYQIVPFALIKTRQILDSLGVVITALATIAIAVFTYSLRQSTDKLWDAGERQLQMLADNSAAQSRDMIASIAVADRAAKAAQTSANSAVAVERGRLYAVIDHNFLNCINAANDWEGPIDQEERPLAMPMWPTAGITFKNYGKSPAIIEEVGTGIEYSEAVPVPVYDVKVVNKNIIAPADESQKFGTVITGQMTMAQAIKVKDGAANIWAYGYVIYDDIFGNRQTHRFFQRLVRVSQFHYVLQSYDHKNYNQSS